MVFSSTAFLLYFLPVFLGVLLLLPRTFKNAWILISSIFFYAWGAPVFVYLLLASTLLDFYLVRHMSRIEVPRKRKLFLFASLFLNLGLLAYFKYANFFVENVNGALENMGFTAIGWTEIALPVGISFYTFQTLTYAIDVYRNTAKPLKYVHHYLLYIFSFPQMIAGPIVRYNEIAAQIVNRTVTIDDRLYGFFRFCIGLAKKVLIANSLGLGVFYIMKVPPEQMSTLMAWVGITAYAFQIYFDFSGYCDMAIGLGRMMGFTFPENFDRPYTARSITEFWRRWHITLGHFMRDYLYIPLGGSRVSSKFRLFFNLWLVFLLSGLWHGASWNFVIWGAYHGAFLILDRLFLKRWMERIGTIPSMLVTFLIVLIGWVFFSIEDLDAALQFISTLFSFESWTPPILANQFWVVLLIAGTLSFSAVLKPFQKGTQLLSTATSLHFSKVLGLTIVSGILFLWSVSNIIAEGFNPFIYYRF